MEKLTDNQNRILSILQHGEGGEFCYNYSNLVDETKIDLKVLKTEIHELKRIGLIEYVRGLMTEDGQVAGSGFTIPNKKWKTIADQLKY